MKKVTTKSTVRPKEKIVFTTKDAKNTKFENAKIAKRGYAARVQMTQHTIMRSPPG